MPASIDSARSVTLIISPYHVGIRGDAVGAGPLKHLDHGLVSSLRALGVNVLTTTVEPSKEGDGDVGRSFEIIRQTSKLVAEARNSSSFPIVVAGNCSASVGVHAGLSGSKALSEEDIGCVWFDAHDDFKVPDIDTSGYFDGMPIAIMAGRCWKAMGQTIPGFRPLKLDRLVHCGLRDLNDLEKEHVVGAGYPVIWGSAERKVDFLDELSQKLDHLKGEVAMVHLDLDCLDVSVGQVNKFEPTAGGLFVEDVTKCMTLLPGRIQPLALTVAGYDPRYDVHAKIPGIAIGAVAAFIQSLMDNGYLASNI